MGEWHALEVLDKALEDTKELLLPFRFFDWLKMAVIVFMAGYGTGVFNILRLPMSLPSSSEDTGNLGGADSMTGGLISEHAPSVSFEDIAAEEVGSQLLSGSSLYILVGGVAFVALLWLVWSVLSAIMAFVFLDVCRSRTIAIKEFFMQERRLGVRYFLFKLGVMGGGLAIAVGVLAAALVLDMGVAAAVPLLLPLFFILLVGTTFILFMTDEFVIVRMIRHRTGVLAAWKDVLARFRSAWRQFLVYFLVRLGVAFALMVLSGMIGVAVVIGLLLILVVGGIIAGGLIQAAQIPVGSLALLALPIAVIVVLAVLVFSSFLRVPFDTFVRYLGIRFYEEVFGEEVVG
jgi:hypothetical protein